jgi:serine/threonine protein kinase
VEAARVFAPIASALEYVHSRSICHRDVKLDNVLLYKHTQAVRLADYGLGEFVQKGKKLKLLCGTPAYVAPEIVENKQYSGTAVDVWSLGKIRYHTIPYNTIRIGNTNERTNERTPPFCRCVWGAICMLRNDQFTETGSGQTYNIGHVELRQKGAAFVCLFCLQVSCSLLP